jgi:hypothetical protein
LAAKGVAAPIKIAAAVIDGKVTDFKALIEFYLHAVIEYFVIPILHSNDFKTQFNLPAIASSDLTLQQSDTNLKDNCPCGLEKSAHSSTSL